MSEKSNTSRSVKVLFVLVCLLVVVAAVQSWFLFDLRSANAQEADNAASSPQISQSSKNTTDPGQWDPFQEMQQLQDRIDNLFGESFSHLDNSSDFGHLFAESGFNPKIDLQDKPKEFVADVNVPGADEHNLNVSVDDQLLTISGMISEQNTDKSGHSLRRERRTGEFSRSIMLPDPVDAAAMTSSYKNGVLEVHIPKQTG